MRIAQVAPLYESVPPREYGGTERIVSFLTEELVRRGHDVTLFASGDSVTAARLVPMCERSLRADPAVVDQLALHVVEIGAVARAESTFDVVHWHVDYLHFPSSARARTPRLTTLHGRLDIPELPAVYERFPDEPVVSISASQRTPLPAARWIGTVHHGLPRDLFHLVERPAADPYLAFLGRMSPEKRPDRAIELARRVGLKLRMAAKVDAADRDYFAREVEPLLGDPAVEFVGEIGDRDKQRFLGEARALLVPIDWPEPFGLVMIEAMACGTPVLAFHSGAVPEVVEPGVTGCVVSDLDEAARALPALLSLDRRGCRARFEERFTAERMTDDYEELYARLREPAA